jgi:hypothetical protein
MFWPVFRSSWLYYPEPLRAKIAISKLAADKQTAIYCREDCLANRLLYKNIIVSALKSNKDLLTDLEVLIINPKVLTEIRFLVIKIWQESGAEPSPKLKEFYSNSDNAFNLRLDLAQAWPQLVTDSFSAEVIGNFKNSSSDQEKIVLLNSLLGKSDPVITKLIWEIILDDYSSSLKNKAWFLLANIENKQSAYQVADLETLKTILDSKDYPVRLKDRAVLILSDYYTFYPDLIETLLVEIVNRSEDFDTYQRNFAIDILNKQRAVKLPNLELSQAELDAYFNNY